MTIDFEEFETKLEKLTGDDYLAAVNRFQKTHKNFFGVYQSEPEFLLEIAALALGENPHEFKTLPIKTFNKVLTTTANAIFTDSDANEIAPEQ